MVEEVAWTKVGNAADHLSAGDEIRGRRKEGEGQVQSKLVHVVSTCQHYVLTRYDNQKFIALVPWSISASKYICWD